MHRGRAKKIQFLVKATFFPKLKLYFFYTNVKPGIVNNNEKKKKYALKGTQNENDKITLQIFK